MKKGFSLVEMLVVIFIFGILGAITTQIILLSVRGAGKSESTIKVRENLTYAVAVMEREIRNANANSVVCAANTITYINASGKTGSFACLPGAGITYIASNSAQITGSDINISGCSLTCLGGTPPGVKISLQAKNTDKTGVESASVDISTQIYLRNY